MSKLLNPIKNHPVFFFLLLAVHLFINYCAEPKKIGDWNKFDFVKNIVLVLSDIISTYLTTLLIHIIHIPILNVIIALIFCFIFDVFALTTLGDFIEGIEDKMSKN